MNNPVQPEQESDGSPDKKVEVPPATKPVNRHLEEMPTASEINIELYKTYVEMTDRFSARRIQIPAIYFTMISGVFIVISFVVKEKYLSIDSEREKYVFITVLCVIGLCLCTGWLLSMRYYRSLGEIKYRVIRNMETTFFQSLAQPYTDEFLPVGDPVPGKDMQTNYFKRLTLIESFSPLIISIPFFALLLYALFKACNSPG